jgi:hypothetical protein
VRARARAARGRAGDRTLVLLRVISLGLTGHECRPSAAAPTGMSAAKCGGPVPTFRELFGEHGDMKVLRTWMGRTALTSAAALRCARRFLFAIASRLTRTGWQLC